MFIRLPCASPATAGPTSLLKLLAGDFAPRVAALWPDPHGGFLAAPAARRHLVCLALALGHDIRSFAERLLTARLRVAIRLAVEAPPAGLERLLGRAGEIAWDVEAYRALIRLHRALVLAHQAFERAGSVAQHGRDQGAVFLDGGGCAHGSRDTPLGRPVASRMRRMPCNRRRTHRIPVTEPQPRPPP